MKIVSIRIRRLLKLCHITRSKMSSLSALGPNQIPKRPKVNQVFVCGNSKYIFNGKYEWEEIENYELERRKREKEEWVPHS